MLAYQKEVHETVVASNRFSAMRSVDVFDELLKTIALSVNCVPMGVLDIFIKYSWMEAQRHQDGFVVSLIECLHE